MKKKACKKCKHFYDGETCPVCKSNSAFTSWNGRIYILDSRKSAIARKIGISVNGEYAIKVK